MFSAETLDGHSPTVCTAAVRGATWQLQVPACASLLHLASSGRAADPWNPDKSLQRNPGSLRLPHQAGTMAPQRQQPRSTRSSQQCFHLDVATVRVGPVLAIVLTTPNPSSIKPYTFSSASLNSMAESCLPLSCPFEARTRRVLLPGRTISLPCHTDPRRRTALIP